MSSPQCLCLLYFIVQSPGDIYDDILVGMHKIITCTQRIKRLAALLKTLWENIYQRCIRYCQKVCLSKWFLPVTDTSSTPKFHIYENWWQWIHSQFVTSLWKCITFRFRFKITDHFHWKIKIYLNSSSKLTQTLDLLSAPLLKNSQNQQSKVTEAYKWQTSLMSLTSVGALVSQTCLVMQIYDAAPWDSDRPKLSSYMSIETSRVKLGPVGVYCIFSNKQTLKGPETGLQTCLKPLCHHDVPATVYVDWCGKSLAVRYQTHPSDKRELQAPRHTQPHTHVRAHSRLHRTKTQITHTLIQTHSRGLQVSHEKLLAAHKQLRTWLLLSSVMDEAKVC